MCFLATRLMISYRADLIKILLVVAGFILTSSLQMVVIDAANLVSSPKDTLNSMGVITHLPLVR